MRTLIARGRRPLLSLAGAFLFLITSACTVRPQLQSSPRVTRPSMGEALDFLRLQLQDEHGVIPRGALLQAYEQTRVMRAQQEARFGKAGVGRANWVWIGPGNVGGRVISMLIDPGNASTMVVGTAGGGIWKSTNGAASWAPVDDFLPTLSVTALVANPTKFSTMYAGTGEGLGNGGALFGAGVFKSTDGGDSWSQLSGTRVSDFGAVNSMAISLDGQTLLAGTTNGGIWRSADEGNSWTRVLDSADISSVAFHPSDRQRAIASGRQGDVFFSTDGGTSWNNATGVNGTGRVVVAYAPSNGSTVYASSADASGTLYRSTDGGQSYTQVNAGSNLIGGQGWIHNVIWVDPTNASTLVVGGLDWYRSNDAGATFKKISRWQRRRPGMLQESSHADEKVMMSAPGFDGTTNRTVWVGDDGGVFRTQNIYSVEETAGWEELNNNLGVTQFYWAAGNPTTNVVVGGTQDNGTVRYSGDAQKYTPMFGGDGGFCAADPNDSNFFYGEYTYLTINRSTTGGDWKADYIYGKDTVWNGSAWETVTRAKPITEAQAGTANFIAPFMLDPNNSNRMLAGARSLWVSDNVKEPNDNGGPAWRAIKGPAGSSSSNNISAIAVAEGNSDVIYVGHNNGEVYRSANGNSGSPSWQRVGAGTMPNRFVNGITIDPKNSDTAYVVFGGFRSDNIWRTTDGGASWSASQGSGSTAIPPLPVRSLAVHPRNSSWLYAGTETGIFTSEDAGQTWTVPQDGPSNASVRQLFWLKNTLYAVTFGRGIYKADISASGNKSADCYALSLESDPPSAGALLPDVQPNCGAGLYTSGTLVTVRANPRLGYALGNWRDDPARTEATRQVVMNANQSVGFHFATAAATCYTLRTLVDPPGSGSVVLLTPPNCGTGYTAGTDVLIESVPSSGFLFGGWSGDADGVIDPDTSVVMTSDRTVTAVNGVPAPNDEQATALVVPASLQAGSPFRVSFVTEVASNAPDDPYLCDAGKTARTVWFRYTPSKSGTIRIDTADSSYHTVVAAFTGTRGNLKSAGCSSHSLIRSDAPTRFGPDVIAGELAALDLKVTAGTSYLIEVGDATPPDEDEEEYTTGEDVLEASRGGLLQVTISAATPVRGRAAPH